ncbi:hypothetical protein GGS21DRAFT_488296 [Xylaria nigripes]|nr:hypothetical protein GGS21DRAFT_488296 [Xylaria nigripes]
MARSFSGNIDLGDDGAGPSTHNLLHKYRKPQPKSRKTISNRSSFVDENDGKSRDSQTLRDSQTSRDNQTARVNYTFHDDEYDEYDDFEQYDTRDNGNQDNQDEHDDHDEQEDQDGQDDQAVTELRPPLGRHGKKAAQPMTDSGNLGAKIQRSSEGRATLPKAFEFLQSLSTQDDETEDEYLMRVQSELRNLSGKGSATRKLQMSDLPNQRSVNDKMGETWGPAIERLTSNVRDSVRVSLLLDLNSTSIDALLAFAMKDLDWPQDVRSYAFYMIRKRMKSNLSSWKHRALKSLKEYISALIDEDDEGDFANENELARLQRFLERRFNIDTFVHIFDWVKPVIDLHSSSDKLRTWCTILFAELGAYAKRHIDWQRDPESRETDPFNTANFLNRFDILADIPQLQNFKPNRSDVKIIQTVKKATPVKKQSKKGLTDHLNDPHVFIPQAKKSKHT